MNKELRKIAQSLRPVIHLGKNGISETFLKSVDDYLKAHEILKIKVEIAEDSDSLSYFAEEVAKELLAEVVDKRGFTFTLYRKKS